MRCIYCKREIGEDARHCPYCGAKVERYAPHQPMLIEENRQNKKGSSFLMGFICGLLVLSAVVAVIFLTGKFSGDSKSDNKVETELTDVDVAEPDTSKETKIEHLKIEGSGFDTPEAAAIAYLEALKAGDVKAMISTFAVETYVDRYDVSAYIDAYKHIQFQYLSQPFEPIDEYTKTVNTGKRIGELCGDFTWQYMVLSGADIDDLSSAISVGDGREYEDGAEMVEYIMDARWMERISQIQIHDSYDIVELYDYTEYYDDYAEWEEEYSENVNELCQVYGCDEIRGVVITFSIGNAEYFFATDVVRYDDVWYNCRVGGHCGSYMGINVPHRGMILQSEVD